MTTADFLIEDPFSGFSGEDKLKAHPKKFKKKIQKKVRGAVVQSSQGHRLTGASWRRMGPGARRQRAPLRLPDELKGLRGGSVRLELLIVSGHQEDSVRLGQDEMDRGGHCTGCGRVRLFKRNCCQM